MDKGNLLAYMGGIVRIATALLGGYLAQKGLATEAEIEGLVGAGVRDSKRKRGGSHG